MPTRLVLPPFSTQHLCALAAALLLACSQGEGGQCQEDGDCDDGLVCDIGGRGERGTCRNRKDITVEEDAAVDAGPEPALPDEDAGFSSEDAATGSEDAATGSEDAATGSDAAAADADIVEMEDAGG